MEYVKTPSFTIYGYLNSTAQTYAEENGFIFIPLPTLAGDANCDGFVNLIDALTVQKTALNLTTLTGQAFVNADMNSDSKINLYDAIAAQKAAMNIA